MINNYNIAGMTCSSCAAKIKFALEKINGIENAEIDHKSGTAVITSLQGFDTKAAEMAITESGKYSLVDIVKTPNFLSTYKPLLIILGYLLVVTIGVQLADNQLFDLNKWMRHFMAGFFLVFSFFKLLDVPAFAQAYSSYDLLAKRWPFYARIYPYIELFLGLGFAFKLQMNFFNIAALLVMGFSSLGVINALNKKQTIQCACLGSVFNLPMSTVTLLEDLLMVSMSAYMLLSK